MDCGVKRSPNREEREVSVEKEGRNDGKTISSNLLTSILYFTFEEHTYHLKHP